MARKPDPSILENLAREHIPYEIWMLRGTHEVLSNGTLGILNAELERILMNATIEAFGIHARGLIAFFKGEKGSNASFFTDDTYKPFKNGALPKALATKLDTQIAHLTHARTHINGDKLDGPARKELFDFLEREIAEFMRGLKLEFKAVWGQPIPGQHPTIAVQADPSATNAPPVIISSSRPLK